MPRIAKELSAIEVSRIHDQGLHFVGNVPGLILQVKGASRSWILRIPVGGKRRDIGLGGFPAVGLAQARNNARDIRIKVAQGIDPIQERRDQHASLKAARGKLKTFSAVMRGFLEDRSPGWRNPKHQQQWENTLATYAVPEIGNLFVKDIELAHILNILRPLWTTKTETASRLRGRLENVLDWAKVHGYREGENPARWKGNLDMVLPAPSKTKNVKHHKALPYSQVGSFMVDLRKRSGVAAKALEFTILTATRSGEVRGATWQEINLEKAEWTVPSERMKARKEHRIPLSPRVIELLKGIPQGEPNEIVFKAPRGGMLSDMSLGAVLKRMEVPVTVHGFRSTFRDWAGETTAFPREVIEHALAHQLQNKAEAAYARGTLLFKRRKLMESWATYCSQRTGVLSDILQMSGNFAKNKAREKLDD